MPWYFYGKAGVPVTPRPAGVLTAGTIVASPLPYTATEPEGYLFCNGQSVSKTVYIDLFSAIGTIFGPSTVTNFTVPDLRTRMPRGIISSASGIGVAPFTSFSPGSGGGKTHSHSMGDHTHAISDNHGHTMPVHSHTFPDHTHSLVDHNHLAGGLTIGNSNSVKTNADTREDTQFYEQLAVNDEAPVPGVHNHGGNMAGITNTVHQITTGDDPNHSNSGNSTVNSLDGTNVVGNSGLGGAATSTSVSQYPPYYTVSFLIKT